jgi:hypothetical protein
MWVIEAGSTVSGPDELASTRGLLQIRALGVLFILHIQCSTTPWDSGHSGRK